MSRLFVRQRLLAATVGLATFAAFGAFVDWPFWAETWFFIGLGIAISATFVEPYFARPQDAIVNALGGLGAFAAVPRAPIETLWLVYAGVLVLLFSAGVVATVAGEGAGRAKWIAFRISYRLGRAWLVGGAALALVVLGRAAKGDDDFEYLALGTAALLLATGLDWHNVLVRLRSAPSGAAIVGAVGPRVLLVVSNQALETGQPVSVETGTGTGAGTVVARLPHQTGLQYRVALDRDWDVVAPTFPSEAAITSTGNPEPIAGVVGVGTTETRLVFEPPTELAIGDPVTLRVNDRTLLYQVVGLEIVASTAPGSTAALARAHARVVGWPANGHVEGGTYLPSPHQPIFRAPDLEQTLPAAYYEIGLIKGTKIPIGIRVDNAWRGHIAVLGMSGMGKTAVAHRICQTLGASNVVLALDTTGEYSSRLGFPTYTGDLNTNGYSVYEPPGDPPEEAAKFIEACMTAGRNEYAGAGPVRSRIVLLEEAHSFVPEWNFGLRHHQDWVSKSTRRIMQARKFGLTFVIVSQRTAVVSKSALSQCENYIILRTIDATSLEYLETIVGADLRGAIGALERYEAICVGPAFNSETPVIVTLSAP